jgi:DNA polymerase-3 subunit alpha
MASETGNIDRLTLLAEDARRMGVTIHPPSVNESGAQFSVGAGGEVVYALSAVRNVGEGPAREIERERMAAGPYRSIFDLCSRVDLGIVSRRALESLAGAGATDCLGGSRAGILSSIGQAWEFGSRARALREAGQMSLFGGGAREEDESEPALPDVPEMDSTARLNLEKSLLGFYLSGHPMDDFSEDIGAFSDIEPGSDMPLVERRRMRMAGVVTGRREIPTQNGAMAFVTIEGRSGSSEVIAFSEALAAFREVLEPGSFVMIEGEVTQRRDERRLSIASAFPISEARHRLNAGIRIRIDTGGLSIDRLMSAVDLIAGSPGRGGVALEIRHPSGRRVRAVSRSMKVDPADGLLRRLREILGEESVSLVAGNGSSR